MRVCPAGILLYGYVHTMADVAKRLARPQAEVVADINGWYDSFGQLLAGVFLDEVEPKTKNVRGAQRGRGAGRDMVHR